MRILLCVLMLGVAACTSTVIPKHVQPTVASFDGNHPNSGVVAYLEDGSALVTQHWVDRYRAMAAVYGSQFKPPLSTNVVFSPISIVLSNVVELGYAATKQQRADFMTMNRWRREPPK